MIGKMIEFVLRYWIGFGFGLLTTGVSVVYRKFHCKVKEIDYLKEGMRALLRDRIVQAYNHYMEKGFCPIYAREVIEDMFIQYTALGGNGTVKDLFAKLMKLPTERKKEA